GRVDRVEPAHGYEPGEAPGQVRVHDVLMLERDVERRRLLPTDCRRRLQAGLSCSNEASREESSCYHERHGPDKNLPHALPPFWRPEVAAPHEVREATRQPNPFVPSAGP